MPTMMLQPNSEYAHLLKQIDFGFEVEAFLKSEIGSYLVRRADAEIEEAVEGLKHCDPEDPKAIRALQYKIAVAESIQYWLGEAITSGLNAQEELHNQGA